MKTYAIIPARSGSKGVPDKNIRLLRGKPLIQYSIDTALECGFDECIVTTDSVHYAKLSEDLGAKALIRPAFLSKDTSRDIDYLLHCIYTMNLDDDGLIVLLRPTTPIRKVKVVKTAIDVIMQYKNKVDSLRSIHELNEPPQKMTKISDCGLLKPYMDITMEQANAPRQDWDKCYHPNGYVDVMRIDKIIENKNSYGNIILPYITEKVIEIDSIEDFEMLKK
jgi:CMP-N-acetylneuraminic acid synthetase